MDFEIYFSNQKDALLLHEMPPGVSLTKPDIIIRKGFDAPDIAVSVVIGIATGVPSSLVASWLYDKLKHHKSRQICINRKEIHISEGELTKIIEETIKVKE